MSRLKKGDFLSKLMFFLGLLLLWSLMRGFFEFRRAYKRVDDAKMTLESEEARHEELSQKLKEAEGQEHIEKMIRNELNMQKEGEAVVVLPDDDKLQVPSVELPIEKERGNWEKWLDLLR